MALISTASHLSKQQQLLYQRRFQNVIDHIYNHLDEALDLNRLAEIACVSPYHWHRIYHGITGETLAATVKRLRLHRAAGQLVNTDQSIELIAKQSGYTRLQSFSRAFSEVYDLPPARYRNEGNHTQFQQALNSTHVEQTESERKNKMTEVTIKNIDAFEIIASSHTGSYMNIGNAFEKLFGWLGVRGLISPQLRSVAIYYSDPDSVAEDQLQSAACVALPNMSSIELDQSLEKKTITAGEYAVFRHKGPYAEMRSVYQWLYGQWLPNSGRDVADQPVFEEYLNNPREVAPADLLTDIYLPLKS
jgi:AraC family transcriptional regulator